MMLPENPEAKIRAYHVAEHVEAASRGIFSYLWLDEGNTLDGERELEAGFHCFVGIPFVAQPETLVQETITGLQKLRRKIRRLERKLAQHQGN